MKTTAFTRSSACPHYFFTTLTSYKALQITTMILFWILFCTHEQLMITEQPSTKTSKLGKYGQRAWRNEHVLHCGSPGRTEVSSFKSLLPMYATIRAYLKAGTRH